MPPAHLALDDPDTRRSLRILAEQAARAGGAVAREWFQRDYGVRRKADGSIVTDADQAAQAAVIACLRAARPEDAVIAEESDEATKRRSDEGEQPRASARAATRARGSQRLPPSTQHSLVSPSNDTLCWIIDPLDGTRNYVCGLPLYACSVAAMLGGYPVVGAIYCPQGDEMYSASAGDGLLINGRPEEPRASARAAARARSSQRPAAALPVAKAQSRGRLRKPLVGIPSSLQGSACGIVQEWTSRVVIRNLGSTAMHLALVAAGRFQAALISDSRLWDIAAGWLMVIDAGGVMTTLDGQPVFPLDLARYGGEALPSLAAQDPQTHARLLPAGYPP